MRHKASTIMLQRYGDYKFNQNFANIKRIYKMTFSKPIDNGLLQKFIFKAVPAYFIAIYVFLQLLIKVKNPFG